MSLLVERIVVAERELRSEVREFEKRGGTTCAKTLTGLDMPYFELISKFTEREQNELRGGHVH